MYSGVKNVEYVYVSLFPCPSSSPVGSKASLGSHLSFQAAERFSTEAFPGLQHLVVRYNGQVLSIPAIVPVGRLAIEHDDVSKIYIYTYVCNIHTYALYMYTHNVDIRMQIYIYICEYMYMWVFISGLHQQLTTFLRNGDQMPSAALAFHGGRSVRPRLVTASSNNGPPNVALLVLR